MRAALFVAAAALAAALSLAAPASAETKITVGIVPGGTTFHLPTYVAMERGFFKKQGLDARWVRISPKALVTAGITGELDFVPVTVGGAVAALHGAAIVYVVGQSSGSPWMIVADKDIKAPEELRGKTIAYGQPATASYDEGATVLSRFFHMEPGKDYKVISFQGQPDEIAALENGSVQAALLTVADAVKAEKAGFGVVVDTGRYMPRLAGPIWASRAFVDKNRDIVEAFIRAIAEAVTYIRDNKQGTMPIFKTYLGIDDPEEQSLLWDRLHDVFDAKLPAKPFEAIFESSRLGMIGTGQWPKDKPLPDTETFLARPLLDAALKQVQYVAPPATAN
ncbi:MAG TPA: ABC transporter substrate-binding protein [Stellaceae bacterium]|nr:ABC transporter substrate-binding protein [Stellaceae bacterium]